MFALCHFIKVVPAPPSSAYRKEHSDQELILYV